MKKERNIAWLVTGICGICTLAWFMNSHTPDSVTTLSIFFMLVFITTYVFTFFVANIVRRSIFVASGVVGFLLLRLVGLREPIYIILLIASLISLELYLNKQ